MKFFEFFKIAITSLNSNKLRSALTMLGMIIGVGSVIVLMSVGTGVQNMISSTFEELGTNLLFVQPSNPDAPGEMMGMMYGSLTTSLTMNDAEALEDIRNVDLVVPVCENYVQVSAGNEKYGAVIEGSGAGFQTMYKYEVAAGQFISDINLARRDQVVVLGHGVAEELFGGDDAVGEDVKIKDRRFTVIGVMEPRGLSLMGISFDDLIVVPITTYQTRLFPQKTSSGEDAVQTINIQVSDAAYMDQVTEDIEEMMRKRHRIKEGNNDDFAVTDPDQLLAQFEIVTMALTIFLGLIGGISLLVGSIGIMNIMLVSVTERTREIGLRKAIGAKRGDVLLQFLLEAGMLSLAGGIIGLAGALLINWGISQIEFSGFTIQATVSPIIVLVAVLVSVVIGVAAGIYPAWKAARLNPIEALRHE
jgi:putative ABC transport system permease protein